jgi:DNA polymerase III subunit beta
VTGRDGAAGRRRGIGAVARASGLTVSALRFYDGAGVLRPDEVDPVSGYRWYGEHQVALARVIAALRRVRMPVPEIAAVVAARAARR